MTKVILKPRRLNAGPYHLSRIENGDEPTNMEEGLPDAQLFVVRIANDRFTDIIQILSIGTTPEGYSTWKNKELVVCTVDFYVIVGHLYKMGSYEILWRYVLEYEKKIILAKFHGGFAAGHYEGRTTTQDILQVGLWWPTVHKDSKSYCGHVMPLIE